jgi:drug/metabolite transporter (DMT)-like permease
VSDPRHRLAGAAMVGAAATLWGGWALVLRPAGLAPLQGAVLVLLVLALPAPAALARPEAFRDRGAVVALALLGLADAGNIALYFAAIARGPIGVAVLTHYLAPVLVTLAAPWVTGEPLSRRACWAAPLSLAGLALVLGRPADAPAVTAALGAGSALFYVVIVFAAQRAGRAFSPAAVTALHAVVSVAALLAVSGAAAIPPLGPGALRIAAGTLVCGIVASLLFYGGLGRVPAPVASALTYLEPVVAAGVGLVFFDERLGAAAVAGAAVVVASGLWVALERARDGSPVRRSGPGRSPPRGG